MAVWSERGRVAVRSLNDFITCCLCGGYFVDATAIAECLHTFCKTCIVRYLEVSRYCPVCDILVHETDPLLSLRLDRTLQDLVYKLVPGLLSREMRRRKELCQHKVDIGDSGIGEESTNFIDENTDGRFYTEDENIHVLLEFSHNGKPRRRRRQRDGRGTYSRQAAYRHFLLCPALFTVAHLKKFIRLKFNLADDAKVLMFHTQEPLRDDYSLMDIAYIYTWRRSRPLRLYYSVYDGPEVVSAPEDDDIMRSVSRPRDQTSRPPAPADSRLPVVASSPPDVKPRLGVDVKLPPASDHSITNYFRSTSETGSSRKRRRRQSCERETATGGGKRIKQEIATDSSAGARGHVTVTSSSRLILPTRPRTAPSGGPLSLPVTISKDFIKELVVSRALAKNSTGNNAR